MLAMHELPIYSASYFESDEEFSLDRKVTGRKKRPIDVIGEDVSSESDIQHARKTKRGMRPHTKLFDEEDPWDFLPASTHKTFLSLHNEEPEELCIVNTTNEILLSTDHEQRLTMRQKAVLNKEESLDLLEPEQLLGLSDTDTIKSKTPTEDQQQKKLEKNVKRKEQIPNPFQKTVIDKLLNRKSLTKRSKKGKQIPREQESYSSVTYTVTDAPRSLTIHPKLLSQHPSPMVRYISNAEGNFLCFEENSPIESTEKPTVRVAEHCSIPGCTHLSKYRHSKTLQPVCSLACYKAVQEK